MAGCCGTGPTAKRRKVSLMDAVLGPSPATDTPSPPEQAEGQAAQPSDGARPAPNGNDGVGTLSTAAAQERPPPRLELKDRLRAVGVAAGNG